MATLYIVATPIGNLEDMTLRALRILQEVDLIAAEDTRESKKLLDRYQITTRLISYREAASRPQIEAMINKIISELQAGRSVAYVSDSGTPGLSDPGQFLVRRVAEAGMEISPIPGPSALAAALSIAGVAAQKVLFLGFLPKKKGRQTLLKNLTLSANHIYEVIIIYENQFRLLKTIVEISQAVPQIKTIIICRELTKIYEEIKRGTLQEIRDYFEKNPAKLKGEFTVLFSI